MPRDTLTGLSFIRFNISRLSTMRKAPWVHEHVCSWKVAQEGPPRPLPRGSAGQREPPSPYVQHEGV